MRNIMNWIMVAALAEKRGLTAHEAEMFDNWYRDSVAKYDGAAANAEELYDGFGCGQTLMNYIRRHAREDVSISEAQMVAFLTAKGHASNRVNGVLRFHGIRQLISGRVGSGNYST